MDKSKEPIRLRRRKMPSGLTSLYLDVYVNGKRSYEYLKMYLVEEKTRADKEKNRQTLLLAEAIRSKRVVELRNGQYGFRNKRKAEEVRFWDYYKAMCERRLGSESRGNWGNWYSCMHHLKKYEPRENITFADITQEWVQGFRDYLDNTAVAWSLDGRHREEYFPIAANTKQSYFNKVKACIHQAIEDGILDDDPLKGVEGFKAEEGTRMYLTLDEIKKLSETPCRYDAIKTAFLFSCFTGLRRSDILKMKWGEVHQQGEFTRIIFKQKKTNGLEYLDITPQAAELMGERGEPDDLVFFDIHSPSCTNNTIKEWVARAGINKEITFHCGRHTFATLMLDLGNDLYTVSKLLGHKEIHTTQIYAKVMDKNKQAAVAKIPRILPEKGKEG